MKIKKKNLNFNYNTIILGSKEPIFVIEALNVPLLRLIVTKDRTNTITREMVHSQIKTQYIMERNMKRYNQHKFEKRWERLRDYLSVGNA